MDHRRGALPPENMAPTHPVLRRPPRRPPGGNGDPASVGRLGIRRGVSLRLRGAPDVAGEGPEVDSGTVDPAGDQSGRRASLSVRGALVRGHGLSRLVVPELRARPRSGEPGHEPLRYNTL